MAAITASMVAELRAKTDAPMMECKKALTEADGDMAKAEEVLRVKLGTKAGKAASRVTAEGVVAAAAQGGVGALIEVNCETDFVGRNEAFRALVADLAYQAAYSGDSDVEVFLNKTFIKDESKTVEAFLKEGIATIGENMVVNRIALVNAANGEIGTYVHTDGKKGAVVVAEGAIGEAVKEAARDAAMQAVALRAPYLNRESVPAEVLEAEKAIYRTQAAQDGKPEAMQDKIAEGRLGKYFKENTLNEQAFIKDDKKSVGQVVKEAGAQLAQFIRFEVGVK